MNILKEGVRSALVRLVRYIVFAIIAFAIFWLIGLFSNKKASALTVKGDQYSIDILNKSQYHYFSLDNSYWYSFQFDGGFTNNTDWDLVGFHFNKLSATYNETEVPTTDNMPVDVINYTGILFQTDGTGIMCYMSGEFENFFVCPITKGTTYHNFTLIANTITIYGHYVIYNEVEIERNKTFFNYDSTDVIEGINNSGGFGNIVVEQQVTNTTLTQQYNFLQQNDQQSVNTTTGGSLDTLSGKFNDMLNGWGGQWSTLTRVVFEPIQLLINIGDTQNTCQPLTLRIPYVSNSTWGDYNIELPCMGNIYNGFFSNFMSVFSTIIVGLYCYRAIIYFLSTIKGVLDAEDDKLEVINL